MVKHIIKIVTANDVRIDFPILIDCGPLAWTQSKSGRRIPLSKISQYFFRYIIGYSVSEKHVCSLTELPILPHLRANSCTSLFVIDYWKEQ